jgi:hypothetical protein
MALYARCSACPPSTSAGRIGKKPALTNIGRTPNTFIITPAAGPVQAHGVQSHVQLRDGLFLFAEQLGVAISDLQGDHPERSPAALPQVGATKDLALAGTKC